MDWYLAEVGRETVADVRREIAAYLRRHAEPGADVPGSEVVASEVLANVAMHAPGPAWVLLQWDAERPTLSVWHLGPGFSLEQAGGGGPDGIGGRGLTLVQRLGGRLSVARRPAGGARVVVTLPVARALEPSLDPPPGTLPSLPAPEEATPDGAFSRESFLRARGTRW